MILFPPPPRRLRRDYTRRPLLLSAASLVGLALLTVVAGVLAWGLASDLRRERAIWSHGVDASQATYEGTETTQKGVTTYDLDVAYVDAAEKAHHGRMSFETMTSIDRKAEPHVRYDAKDPDAFALNVAVDAAGGRWAYAVVLGGLVPAFAAACVVILRWRAHRAVRVARRCAKDGELVVVDLVFPQPFLLRNGKARYDYLLTRPDGSTHRDAADFDAGRGPLFVAGRLGQRQVLGLESASRRGAVLVLREDLHPLDVAPEEAARIAKEAYEATPGAYR